MAKEKKSDPVRLGLIGSGLAVEKLHWPALMNLPGKVRVVVACDIDAAKAQKVAKMAGQDLESPDCRWTTDYHEVLASDEVEAVLLSLPIHLTAQLILEAARSGKHVLSEKPLAANLPHAMELAGTLRGFSNVVVEIAENYH